MIELVLDGWPMGTGEEICPLCKYRPGVVHRKSHKREHGVHLENGLYYCRECPADAREAHFAAWWDEQWATSVAVAEKNWQEHGIHTNVGGPVRGLSDYFGFVKLEDGTFCPYRYVHPKFDVDRFEGALWAEGNRLDALGLGESEKFEAYRKFMVEFEPENEQVAHYRKRNLEALEESIKDWNEGLEETDE